MEAVETEAVGVGVATEAVSEDMVGPVVTEVVSEGVVAEVSEAPENKAGSYFLPRPWRQRFSHGIISIFAAGQLANIDPRLLDDSQDKVLASLRGIKPGPQELPYRPDFGTRGTAIKLRANFFPVKVPKGPLYEYEVTISPSKNTAIRRVKRRIFQLAEGTLDWQRHGLLNNVAHDHSTKLISAKKLPQPLVIKVPYTDEDDSDGTKGAVQTSKRDQKPKAEKKPKAADKVSEYTLTIEFARNIDTQGLSKYVFPRVLPLFDLFTRRS